MIILFIWLCHLHFAIIVIGFFPFLWKFRREIKRSSSFSGFKNGSLVGPYPEAPQIRRSGFQISPTGKLIRPEFVRRGRNKGLLGLSTGNNRILHFFRCSDRWIRDDHDHDQQRLVDLEAIHRRRRRRRRPKQEDNAAAARRRPPALGRISDGSLGRT